MKSKINFSLTALAAATSAVFIFSSSSFASCPTAFPLTFPNANLCAAAQWTQGPKSDGENSMALQFVNAQTLAPADPISPLKVALYMPDMGHGSSPTLLTKTAAGAMNVSKMYFIMEGPWEVRISVGEEQQVLPVVIR